MKCETAERKILLAHSGELGRLRRLLLKRHIGSCPRCRSFAAELEAVSSAYDAAEAPGTPSWLMERILDEGRRAHAVARRAKRPRLSAVWQPALTYSALSLLLLSAFLLMMRPARLADYASQQRIVMEEESLDEEIAHSMEEVTGMMALFIQRIESAEMELPEDEEDLARELLALEGVTI